MSPSSADRARWEAPGETLQFMQSMWGLVHGLEVRSKRMSRTIGVTGPQRLVVRLIGRHPDATAGEIASMLDLHASTLTGILARLEARGMIVRRIDPADRRRARFSLTAEGRTVDRERKGTVEAAVRRTLARATPAQIEHCRELMHALIVELERPE